MNVNHQMGEKSSKSSSLLQLAQKLVTMSPVPDEGPPPQSAVSHTKFQPHSNGLIVGQMNSQDHFKKNKQSKEFEATIDIQEQNEGQPSLVIANNMPLQNVTLLIESSGMSSGSEYDSSLSSSSLVSQTTRNTWESQTENLEQNASELNQHPSAFFIKHFLHYIDGKAFQNYEKYLIEQIRNNPSFQTLVKISKQAREKGRLRKCLYQFFDPKELLKFTNHSQFPTIRSKIKQVGIAKIIFNKLFKNEASNLKLQMSQSNKIFQTSRGIAQ